jgi:hypothetical protein
MRTTLMLFVLMSVGSAASLSFTPSAMVTGQPGDFTGWGYVLTDSRGYAVPTFSEFNPAPDTGLYIDFVGLPVNFVVIPPSTPEGQDFDPLQQTGAGEFFIDPATAPGTTIDGTITLHYDLYSPGPSFDSATFLSGDNTISADVSIGVTAAAPVTDVPEPRTFGLLIGGLALWCLIRRVRLSAKCHLP